MRLFVTIDPPAAVEGEPVVTHLRFVNGSAPVAFPFEQSAQDFTTFSVYDHEGHLLSQVNGYSRDERLGLEPMPASASSFKTEPIEAQGDVAWDENLLDYLEPLATGDYRLSVRLRFRPSAIDVQSEAVPFRVLPANFSDSDVVADAVAMTVVHSVLTHTTADGETRAVFSFRSAQQPLMPWSSVAVADAPPSRPRISEADFSTTESFAHDFSRWIAWLEGSKLTLARIVEHAPPNCFTHELPVAEAVLAGRPIQHRDGSVSVVVAGAGAVHRFRFDAGGQPAGSWRLQEMRAGTADLIATGCNREGHLFVLSAGVGVRATSLETYTGAGEALGSVVLPGLPFGYTDRPRLLKLRLSLKARDRAAKPAALFLSSVGGAESRRVLIGMAHLESGALWCCEWADLAGRLLEEETIAAGDVAADGAGAFEFAIATSAGRILCFLSGVPPVTIDAGPMLLPGSVSLIRVGGGLNLFYTRTDGLRVVALDGGE